VVRVGTAQGDVVRRVELTAREHTLEFAGLSGPPTMIVFDDGNGILKELTFDQPTAWLAMALRRDADLWNRQWVIEQLATRTADTVAAAALVWAATGADYFLTRVAAVEALARFPAPIASAAVSTALRDTSAQVRRAAVTTLAQLGGGARVTELARTLFRRDSSYEVRAAALSALVQVDSSARDSAVAWGLATPSYQDVIEQAAYRIVAQTADTGAIGQIESRLATGRFPAHVLAALAARGSGHALDILALHLDDDRPAVRRWVVEAFQFTLPRQLGVPRLQAVSGKLKYPGTKQDVEKALEQLKKPATDEE
jgi:HEAT repeat protein